MNGTSSSSVSSSTINLTNTTWHHIAATFNLGSVKIYLDGAQIASGTIGAAGSAKLFNSTTLFRVGQNSTGASKLNAAVDEVRVSQVIRYSGPFTPPNAPFTAD